MPFMKWILATAAAQLCAFGAIATLIIGCAAPAGPESETVTEPTGGSGVNRIPEIRNLKLEPAEIVVGGAATVTAQVVDPDGDRITEWTLVIGEAQLPPEGTFNPRAGSGAEISSIFTATRPGKSSVILTVFDGRGGISSDRHPITVVQRENALSEPAR